jgi:hypothetical protein
MQEVRPGPAHRLIAMTVYLLAYLDGEELGLLETVEVDASTEDEPDCTEND